MIAFDAMYDFYECYKAQCPPAIQTGLDALLESGQKEKLNGIMADSMRRNPRASWTIHQGMHVTGTETPFDYLMAMRNFTTRGCAHLVEQDVMLMAGTKDDYIPLEMLYKQMQVLTNAKSITARVFTEADHAQDHCQMSNIKLALETIIDWMEQMKPCQ